MNIMPLTVENRTVLTDAFSHVPRVDIAFDCAIDGLAGEFLRSGPGSSEAFLLIVAPFCYFAGDPDGEGSAELLRSLGKYHLIMPSVPGWFDRTRKMLGRKVHPVRRFSYSADSLSLDGLEAILAASPYRKMVVPITHEDAREGFECRDHVIDLTHFRSADDFMARGLGFEISEKATVVGAAYSSLANSHAIEASLFVHPQHRRMGLGTALAARLLVECLHRNVRPNWDAANLISCRLGEKLGLTAAGAYEALEVR